MLQYPSWGSQLVFENTAPEKLPPYLTSRKEDCRKSGRRSVRYNYLPRGKKASSCSESNGWTMFEGSDRYDQQPEYGTRSDPDYGTRSEPDYGSRTEPADESEKGSVGLLEVSQTLYSDGLAEPIDPGAEWMHVTVKCEGAERVSAIKETHSEHSGLLAAEREVLVNVKEAESKWNTVRNYSAVTTHHCQIALVRAQSGLKQLSGSDVTVEELLIERLSIL